MSSQGGDAYGRHMAQYEANELQQRDNERAHSLAASPPANTELHMLPVPVRGRDEEGAHAGRVQLDVAVRQGPDPGVRAEGTLAISSALGGAYVFSVSAVCVQGQCPGTVARIRSSGPPEATAMNLTR